MYLRVYFMICIQISTPKAKMLKDLWLCLDCTMSSQNPTISKYELLRYVMYLTISHYISLYLSNMQVLYPQQTSQQPHLWDPRTAAGVQPVGPWWTWVTHLDQLEPELNTYWCVKHVGNGWDMMGCWDYDLLILWIIFSKIPYVKRTSKNSVKMQKKKMQKETSWSSLKLHFPNALRNLASSRVRSTLGCPVHTSSWFLRRSKPYPDGTLK